jgi:hypothetical protein
VDTEQIAFGLIFGTIAGLLVGVVPLIVGVKKNQTGLGVGGFFATAISGALFGLILAIPIASVFTWLSVKAAKNKSESGS